MTMKLEYEYKSYIVICTSIKTPPKMMDTERSKVRWVRSMLAERAATLIKDW